MSEDSSKSKVVGKKKYIQNSELGIKYIKDLTGNDLQKYYNQKTQSGLSAKTVRHLAVIIREALRQAVRLNYIPFNPHDAVVLPKKERYAGMTLSKADVKKFMELATE